MQALTCREMTQHNVLRRAKAFAVATLAVFLTAGPASASIITVTQDTPGGLDFTVFYNAEATTLLRFLDLPIAVFGTTCKAGVNPNPSPPSEASCEAVDLTNSRFGGTPVMELPGATGDWTTQTRIENLGGGSWDSNPGFGLFPGIETIPGDSFVIGEFLVAGSTFEVVIADGPPYVVKDLDALPIPLTQARGTVLFSNVPTSVPALPPWMLGLLAVLLGVTVGAMLRGEARARRVEEV